MRSYISAFCLFFFSFTASPQLYEYQKVPGKNELRPTQKATNRADAKSKNGFSATLAITKDQTIFERWNKPSKGFSIVSAKEVVKNEIFMPLVFFHGALKDPAGISRVTYILTIIRPDGKKLLEEVVTAWNGETSHNGMQINQRYISVSIDPEDPLGLYEVRAVVRDEVAMLDIELVSKINVVAQRINPVKKLTDKEVSDTISYFYLDKNFALLGTALVQMESTPGWSESSAMVVTRNFMEEVFRSYPERARDVVSSLVGLSKEGMKNIYDSLWMSDNPSNKKYLLELQKKSPPDEKEYIATLVKNDSKFFDIKNPRTPADLDLNWTRFFASGKESYVQNIISALNPDLQDSVNKTLMYTTAMWSIQSNCEQHKKVFRIVKKHLAVEKDQLTKSRLETIIKELEKEKRDPARPKAR